MWKINSRKLTPIVFKNSKCSDGKDEERDGGDSRVEIEKVAVVDDSKEVADRRDGGEHASGDKETVDPVAHDWTHRHSAGARIEPERKSERGQEETGQTDEIVDVFSLESFDERVPEAAVEHVSQAGQSAPGKDAGNEAESVEAVVDRDIVSDTGILDGRKDSEGKSQEEGNESVEFEGRAPVNCEEHEDESPYYEARNLIIIIAR